MTKLFKSIIAISMLVSACFADEVHTLTSSDLTYKATVKSSDTVFYNIVGKTSPTRTNLIGWLNLKTNLMTQGFAFTSKENKPYTAAKGYLKEDQITRQNKEFAAEQEREAALRRAAIAAEVTRRAGEIGYQLKKRDERIAEGLTYWNNR
jgi:hypothetical protein